MRDIFSKEKRSEIMGKIKSNNNASTEKRLMQFFKDYKIKFWKRNYKIKGKPDFVFPKLKIALFADGCFWHGHDCRNLTPKINSDYWNKKIRTNIERDKINNQYLKSRGWNVIRIWECELKKANVKNLATKFEMILKNSENPNSPLSEHSVKI